jgi:hypothetical protein
MGRLDKYRKLPIFRKSEELVELVEAIAGSLKEEVKTEYLAAEMMTNAYLIQAKIAGAEGGSLYSLRMQNAVLIKLAAHDMFNAVSAAAMFKIGEEDYVDLMREKVEEFRLVFVDWIRGFDRSYDIPDNWAIRFDSSTPEQEKLEDMRFNQDERFDGMPDSFDDIDFDALNSIGDDDDEDLFNDDDDLNDEEGLND